MIDFGANWHVGITSVLRRYFVGALSVALVGFPGVALADPGSEAWVELSKKCEAVILEQSFAPLEDYAPAPFTFGKPGLKDFSVYGTSQELVATARVVRGDWVLCTVRESEEDRSHTQSYAAAWGDWFAAAYPRSEYLWHKFLVRPDRLSPVAVRCRGEDFALIVYASLETDFHYRVIVTNDAANLLPRKAQNPCLKEDS